MKEYKYHVNLIVPGITAMMELMDFEVDMFVLTKSDLGYGFEIKVTRADLLRELKKIHYFKREYYRKFRFFFYVVPAKLEELAHEIVPEFCGIWVVDDQRKMKLVRKPTVLSRNRWTAGERYEIARLGAMRIYNLKRKIAAHG
jgi:hypothetical protein